MECCICGVTVQQGAVLSTVEYKGRKGVTACIEHLRQAVSQSDGPQLTEEEWQTLARETFRELSAHASDTGTEQK